MERDADTWLNLKRVLGLCHRRQVRRDYDPINDVAIKSEDLKEICSFQSFTAQGRILVPFAPESKLSGVERLGPDQILRYRRIVTLSMRLGNGFSSTPVRSIKCTHLD